MVGTDSRGAYGDKSLKLSDFHCSQKPLERALEFGLESLSQKVF